MAALRFGPHVRAPKAHSVEVLFALDAAERAETWVVEGAGVGLNVAADSKDVP